MTVVAESPESTELRQGALGLGFIIFFVISAAGPLVAIAGGFPIGIMLGNGAGTPSLLIATVAILLVFSAGYTAMARHITNAGGFYAFTARGLGGTAGGAAALLALLGYNTMQIGLYGMFGAVVSGLLGSRFGIDAPWWACSFVALASIAVLGYRQIDLSAKVLSVLVFGEYIVVLILDLAILKAGGDSGINGASFTPHAFLSGTPAIGLLFCFASFIGFEATTIYSEEAKDPHRTVPLATYISVLLIGVFYAFSVWCMVIGAGDGKIVKTLTALSDPTTFLYTLSDHYANKTLTTAMSLLFITSVYAGLLAFHNSASRYFFAAGREGLLPKMIGRTHRIHQSPHIGSIIQTVLAAAVVLAFVVARTDPVLTLFSWLTNVATLCIIALMALSSAAVFAFFRRVRSGPEGPLRTFVAPLVAGLTLAVVLVLAIVNFSVLTGASVAFSYALTALLPVFAVIGTVLARKLKRRDPQAFARLGSSKL
ncbi:APC family permease [Paraburkholderia caffeinilytica]|uniref:Amino acid permease n=1 Tax=Paraburkholderia caffeinilytica TaxID=1761016 RepID=A0ABQ1ME28_9BURK|nr:APC family permease [Paraburkholderia caffeinilytica]GGC39152.1 amino acid permease [Paraburkholderia caffeinilytica]CAB3786451.1 Putrescine importer PuuP [Paraburkholderia caffeinilytica]